MSDVDKKREAAAKKKETDRREAAARRARDLVELEYEPLSSDEVGRDPSKCHAWIPDIEQAVVAFFDG